MERVRKNKKIYYAKEADVLWFFVKSGPEIEYKEIAPGISVELGESGELLGIEILNASKVLNPILSQKQMQIPAN
ncbi:MAG: DUF2283 domain-containing protein [Candidatus Levyibacteriota bacterium]|nr:MAG: DUF2283 domain-containing protein [Candidatus Levybacteria bacterium]